MNVPVLYENVLYCLNTEQAKNAFFWCADRHDKSRMKYFAERYAHEVEMLIISLSPMIDAANKPYAAPGDTLDDLMKFILKRHASWRLGGNIKMWWETKQ